MAYKELPVSGSKWQRANRIIIENPVDAVPMIVFVEEEVTRVGSLLTNKPLGDLRQEMDNPLETFKLLDPGTMEESLETCSYGHLYALMVSLYVHLDKKRTILNTDLP